MPPKISVIIPVYNTEKYLVQCLESVVSQTLKDIEIICVDDGSTDNSLSILREYEKKDNRFIVLTQKHSNAGVARNRGMDIACGEYLSFLDSDDFFELHMLEEVYKKCKRYNADIAVYNCDFYNEQTRLFETCNWSIRRYLLPDKQPFSGKSVKKNIFDSFMGWPWDKLVKFKFIKENSLRFQDLQTTEDLYFVYSSIVKASNIVIVDKTLAHHRKHAESISANRETSWHCFYYALIALRNQLTQWNLYERFELDYINYALSFSLWNLETIRGLSFDLMYDKLRTEWFDGLGITKLKRQQFYNRNHYKQYMRIMELTIDEYLSKKNGGFHTKQQLDKRSHRSNGGFTWMSRKIAAFFRVMKDEGVWVAICRAKALLLSRIRGL